MAKNISRLSSMNRLAPWSKPWQTTGTGTPTYSTGQASWAAFILSIFFVAVRRLGCEGHQNAHINPLSADCLVAMDCNCVVAGVKCRLRLFGDLEIIVVGREARDFHGQHSVQIYFSIFIVKNLQFHPGHVFRFQSELPSQPDVGRCPDGIQKDARCSRSAESARAFFPS